MDIVVREAADGDAAALAALSTQLGYPADDVDDARALASCAGATRRLCVRRL